LPISLETVSSRQRWSNRLTPKPAAITTESAQKFHQSRTTRLRPSQIAAVLLLESSMVDIR
jgi:hypothetical protein